MSRGVRSLVGLLVGLFTVVLTGIGSAAYATVGPPDPLFTPATLPPPPPAPAGPSLAQEIGWMAWGAAVVLLVAALVAGMAVLSRRHQVQTRQLRMP